VADEFKIFTNDERSFVTMRSDVCIVPPNSFALARSVEYFKIPRDVLTICVGKSTYARCGIIVNVTPLSRSGRAFVTLEIPNTTPLPARICANQGLRQILSFQCDEVCETSYAPVRANTSRRRRLCCRSCRQSRGKLVRITRGGKR